MRFEHSIYNVESVTRLLMRGDLSRTTNSFQIELRLKLIDRMNFVRLKLLHLIFDIVQIYRFSVFSFPKNCLIGSKRKVLCPDIRAVLFLIFSTLFLKKHKIDP